MNLLPLNKVVQLLLIVILLGHEIVYTFCIIIIIIIIVMPVPVAYAALEWRVISWWCFDP